MCVLHMSMHTHVWACVRACVRVYLIGVDFSE